MESRDNPLSLQSLPIYLIAILFYTISYTLLMTIPFYVLSLGASKTDIGLIMGASMFVSMLLRPVAGVVIDRYGPRLIFLGALLVFTVSLFGYFVPSLWMFGAVRLVYGLVSAFFSTAMGIMVIELFSEQARGQGLSLYSLSTMIPSAFAPALALYLKEVMPIQWIFAMLIGVGALNFLFGLMLYLKSAKHKQKPKENSFEPGAWKNRVLIVASLTMMIGSMANGAIFTFLPLYLAEGESAHASSYFLIQMITLVLCRFALRKFIPSDGRKPQALILTATALLAAGTLVISTSVSLPFLLVAGLCNGIAFAMLYPTLMTFVSFSVPERSRGFLLGVFSGVDDLGFALGSLLMGVIVDHFSYPPVYVVCSVFCVLGFFLFGSFKHRKASPYVQEANQAM